jgi:hypothetical protein
VRNRRRVRQLVSVASPQKVTTRHTEKAPGVFIERALRGRGNDRPSSVKDQLGQPAGLNRTRCRDSAMGHERLSCRDRGSRPWPLKATRVIPSSYCSVRGRLDGFLGYDRHCAPRCDLGIIGTESSQSNHMTPEATARLRVRFLTHRELSHQPWQEVFRVDLIDSLRKSANDWAPAIQALAAFVTVGVAAIATWIAKRAQTAEAKQAEAAEDALEASKEETKALQAAERNRERETQLLAIKPQLIATAPKRSTGTGSQAGRAVAVVSGKTSDLGPALDLRVTLHRDGIHATVELGSRSAGDPFEAEIPLDKFVTSEMGGPTSGDPHEVIVEWRGLLGQSVVETYEWFTDQTRAGSRLTWRLRRLTIAPSLPDAQPLELEFSEPAP